MPSGFRVKYELNMREKGNMIGFLHRKIGMGSSMHSNVSHLEVRFKHGTLQWQPATLRMSQALRFPLSNLLFEKEKKKFPYQCKCTDEKLIRVCVVMNHLIVLSYTHPLGGHQPSVVVCCTPPCWTWQGFKKGTLHVIILK